MMQDYFRNFSALVASQTVSCQDFFAKHWRSTPVVLRGEPSRFENLLASADLQRALASPTCRVKYAYRDSSGTHKEFWGTARQATDLLAAGLTTCISNIERYSPSLREICSIYRSQLRSVAPVYVNLYQSPDDGGFNMHFDCMDVFILQVEGRKRWEISSTRAIENPMGNCLAERMEDFHKMFPEAQVRTPSQMSMEQVVLEPGDVLYLPAGVWHQGRALNFSSALSLTIDFQSRSKFLGQVVESLFRERSILGSLPLPIVEPGGQSRDSAIVDSMSPALGELKSIVADLDIRTLIKFWDEQSHPPK